ncbi:hypothetical protein NVP1101O_220 [Vibrio phage 1.101.O._10N.261.45.C6]|nr:hypothetical protein NVP1101O_220 [Vibrio phage 1.101.O._10N.261.45.C6]
MTVILGDKFVNIGSMKRDWLQPEITILSLEIIEGTTYFTAKEYPDKQLSIEMLEHYYTKVKG